MDTFILAALALLGALAVIDLFVGVSNDAVNFLNSAVGSRTAPFWVIMTVASLGVLLGGLEQTHLVVVAQHAHRYAREPGELAYLQHGETSLGPIGRRSIA